MIKVAVVGLGKMGLSHLSMIKAHPDVDLVAVCDSSGYVLSMLKKYTMLNDCGGRCPDRHAVALPRIDGQCRAEPRRVHVFSEKPFTLSPADSDRLTDLAEQRGLVTQVGYHNRFVGAFREVKRLLDAGAIGTVTHALGEAYGPVVLKPKGCPLTQSEVRKWRQPVRLRGASARPAQLVPRPTTGGRRRRAQPHLFEGN